MGSDRPADRLGAGEADPRSSAPSVTPVGVRAGALGESNTPANAEADHRRRKSTSSLVQATISIAPVWRDRSACAPVQPNHARRRRTAAGRRVSRWLPVISAGGRSGNGGAGNVADLVDPTVAGRLAPPDEERRASPSRSLAASRHARQGNAICIIPSARHSPLT
jgi:hypothetical protein